MDFKDDLIVVLANLLVQRQVDTEKIQESLTLICHHFSFDSGAVYEVDPYNHFWLKEKSVSQEGGLCQDFKWSQIGEESFQNLSASPACEIVKGSVTENWEKELLQLFGGEAIIVSSVVDQQRHPQGIIVLKREQSNGGTTEEELSVLSVLLSMLGRYAGMRMYQNQLFFARTSYERILDHTGIDIYVNDFHTHDILYVNESMAAPYGGSSRFRGKKCWQVLFPGQSGPCEFCPEQYLLDEHGDPTKVYTWDYQRAFDGSWFRVFSAAFRWVDGRLAHVVSSADITDNKQKEELIQRMANYDSLTNLPNRRMLIRNCESQICQGGKKGSQYVLFFDLDNFKQINDTMGHDAGDELLIQLGEFFSNIPMLRDAIYRNGGDEFVALIGGEDITKDHIRNLANFIHIRFQKPWKLSMGEVYSGTSIGVASYPEDGYTAEELLRKADKAMYHVKKTGGGGVFFANEIMEEQND